MDNPSEKARAIPGLWNRNFLLLWQGQFISSLGKQAFAVTAMLWLKDATGSGSLMGLVMTVSLLPAVVLGPLAGVFVDMFDRRKIIAWTDVAGGFLVLGAAFAFFLAPDSTPLLVATIFAVTLATGLLDTFSQPSIGASVPDLVPADKLEAANGINMSGIQLAGFVAQGAAGVGYRVVGAPFLVLANAVAYLYAGFTELLMKIPRQPVRADREKMHPFHRFRLELGEGFAYLKGHRGLLTSVVVFAVQNLAISPLLVILPFYVQDFLGLSADWYGFGMAAFGLGAMAGFLLAGIFPVRGAMREAAVSASLIASALLVLAMPFVSGSFAVVALFAAIGLVMGVINVHVMSLTQMAVPSEYRGRVQALMTTISAGVMPLGMALGGFLFDLIGQNVVAVVAVSGGASLLVSLACLLVKDYRAFLRSGPAE